MSESLTEEKKTESSKGRIFLLILSYILISFLSVAIGYYISQSQIEDESTESEQVEEEDWTEEITEVEEEEVSSDESENIYTKLEDIVVWDSKEYVDSWGAINLDSEVFDTIECNIMSLSKVFNGTPMSGSNIDEQLELYRQERGEDLKVIKDLLVLNGWDLVSNPATNDFYSDYLYSKDDSYILLQEGDRDAVLGGIYVRVKYCDLK